MIAHRPPLVRDSNGSVAVEFGLVAPAFLVMLLGVFQIGAWMQAYNAMRNAVTETARNVAVEYQTENRLSRAQIADTGFAVATSSPYLLDGDYTTIEVEQPVSQRILGARELKLTLTYQMPTFLSFAGIDGPTVTYSRALFVTV